MVSSNGILYEPGEHPDHVVVIKYVLYVGDSKRAMDEYTSEIFMGGKSTVVLHNTSEDSLLAAPIILDLVILAAQVPRRGQIQLIPSSCNHPKLLHKGPSCATRDSCCERVVEAEGNAGEHPEGMRGFSPDNNMILEYK